MQNSCRARHNHARYNQLPRSVQPPSVWNSGRTRYNHTLSTKLSTLGTKDSIQPDTRPGRARLGMTLVLWLHCSISGRCLLVYIIGTQSGRGATFLGSYLRLIDSCITQIKAQGPSRTCDESKEEDERRGGRSRPRRPRASSSQFKNNYLSEM